MALNNDQLAVLKIELDTDPKELGYAGTSHPEAAALLNEINVLITSGTAQAGTASTIRIAAGESGVNDIHNGRLCVITGGTGAGQERVVDDYNGANKTANVSPDWETNPDGTSTYEIRNYETVPNSSILKADVLSEIVMDELPNIHTNKVTAFFSMFNNGNDTINIGPGSNAESQIGQVFTVADAPLTRTALLALRNRVASRGETLFGAGVVVTQSDVAEARLLP